jgi:hypothetical protein
VPTRVRFDAPARDFPCQMLPSLRHFAAVSQGPARWLCGLLLLIALAAGVRPARAQFSPAPDELTVFVYSLRNQPGSEAVAVVQSLLSARGSVQFQPEANNIVVRDTLSVASRVALALQNFDHPVQELRLEVKIIQAGPAQVSGDPLGLPLGLLRRLSELFKFESYRLAASVDVDTREGVEVHHQVGKEYLLSFRVGTVLEDRRIRLSGFRLARVSAAPGARPLLATNLTPWLDQTTVLGLAQEEGAPSALLVAITCRKAQPEPGPH